MALQPDNYNFDPEIELSVPVAPYVINLYIGSCYNKMFDIDDIQSTDFVDFLNFIDRYPTDILSIGLLEKEIIIYMDKNKIYEDEIINNICKKYQLKYLYLFLVLNKSKKIKCS